MRKASFILALILCFRQGFSQFSIEQYHEVGATQQYTFMPIMHFEAPHNWYAEARYNYEDVETYSLFLGRSFKWKDGSCTPLLGGSVGRFKGVSAGVNLELEYDKLYFSTQSQYSYATDAVSENFTYTWSEVGYQGLRWLYGGCSVQQTDKTLEFGPMIGFTFNKITVPFYAFNPLNKERYFIVGLNFSWEK